MAASPPTAAAAASSNNTQAAVPFEVLLNGSAGASASAADIARRERRCRKLEREANEVKDVIWTLNHTVHILENIKHLSRDYIRQLFQLLDATMDESKSDQISVLHQAIGFLETSLKQWEHRYNAITGYSDTFSSSDSNNNNNHHNSNNNSAQQSSSEHQAEEEGEELDGEEEEEEEDEDEVYEIDDEAANGRNYGRVAGGTMPFELCEVSMATADDNNGDHNNGGEEEDEEDEDDDDLENSTFSDNTATSAGEQDHYGSNGGGGNFNSTSAAAASTLKHRKRKYQTQFQQLNLNQLNNSYIANHSLPLVLHCDHPGCSYQTGARRQLAMHKRSHDGEVLYTCDVPGCGYLSNYKGNIKVHKKHRHRIDTTAKGRRQQQQQHHQQQNLTIQGQKRKIELYHSSPQPAPAKVRVEEDFGESSGRRYLGNRAVQQLQQLQHDESLNNTSGTESAARDSNHNQAFGGGGGSGGQALHRCVVEGCDYSSKWKQCLIAHQLQHAGVKPYKCDYPGCHYSTNFKGNVNVHKRVHRESPSTMYECSFAGCGFVTPWKNSILVHQSKHQQQARAAAASTGHNKPLPV